VQEQQKRRRLQDSVVPGKGKPTQLERFMVSDATEQLHIKGAETCYWSCIYDSTADASIHPIILNFLFGFLTPAALDYILDCQPGPSTRHGSA
jgi:hypothetical protein